MQPCNEKSFGDSKEPLLVDSTTITVGKTRLPWVIESLGSAHDGPIGESLANKDYILVNDRAYGKIRRFDQYVQEQQFIVTRIKENITLVQSRSLKREGEANSNVVKGSNKT